MEDLAIRIFIDDSEQVLRYWRVVPRVGDWLEMKGIARAGAEIGAVEVEQVIWEAPEESSRPVVRLYCKTPR